MENSCHSTFSPLVGDLLYQQNETSLNEDIFINTTNYSASDTEEEDEYVQMLIDREISVIGFKTHQSSYDMVGNWIKSARLNAIKWILKTREFFGFCFQTAYLSVTYFDRFLSKRSINKEKGWAIRLLSVACISLAAKMEECKVPKLSEFPVEEYNFESKVIQRMELLVLNTLEWKMRSVTPFAYIHFYITKLCKDSPSPPKIILSRTAELILAIMTDVNLMDHRSSVIAAAATMVVLDQELTKQTLEFKINAFSFLQIEDVFYCYHRTRELDMERIKIPKNAISPDMSPVQLGGKECYDNSSVTRAISSKRKRLTFNDCDQNYGVHEEKRHG
ncbi:hypothetical protein F0562_035817 [Nyssa sinensis]|uniref:Cyclin-like domain-containing protein n=1 Tax=Nyssa sinensis TaxID=561372 RepID=A0A5J5AF22_9ASTE|nr:hypothetical protein F0562_035817 [Nyssa sinensis]